MAQQQQQQPLTELERDVRVVNSFDSKSLPEQKVHEFVHTSGQGLSNLHLLSGRKAPSIEQAVTKANRTEGARVESPRPNTSIPRYHNDLSPDKLGVVGFVTETVSVAKDLISHRIQQRRASIQEAEAKETSQNNHENGTVQQPSSSKEPILVQKVKSLFPQPLVDEDGSPRYKIDDTWGYQHGSSNIGYDPINHPSQAMAKASK